MRLRNGRIPSGEPEEKELERSIRALAHGNHDDTVPPPPDAYWHNLLIRINRRIDAATSGRALSISWAARVAIPGVVTIISFMIGLHYYANDSLVDSASLREIVQTLPPQTVDSLLTELPASGPGDPTNEEMLLTVTDAEIRNYLTENLSSSELVAGLSEPEAADVLAKLSADMK
jgi:hypothetical protein